MGNVWENLFKCIFSLMQQYDVNLMYRKVVELEETYRVHEPILTSIEWVLRKFTNANFHYKNILEYLENVWEILLNLMFQDDVKIKCKIDVQQSCKACGVLSLP